MTNTYTIEPFDPETPLFGQVAVCFRAAWPERFFSLYDAEERIRRHAGYPGFKGLAAITPAGEVVGFAYGYTNNPGQWWHDQIARRLGHNHDPRLLDNSFAFTELVVALPHRRRGLGAHLHDALMTDLQHQHALLSTQHENVAAISLYQRRGWRTLIERMHFDGVGPAFVIMVRSLNDEAPTGPHDTRAA